MKIFKKKQKRTFIYEPYGDNGDAVLLYFHKKPTNPGYFNDEWDMTGVDVPTKECPEWSFWRNIQNETVGNDTIPHDLSTSEMEEIKQYIREHKELVSNMFEQMQIETQFHPKEETNMENKIKEIVERLMKSNEENFENIDSYDDKSYAIGYAEGVHDGLLDILNELGIETDKEYYN